MDADDQQQAAKGHAKNMACNTEGVSEDQGLGYGVIVMVWI